MNRNPYLPPATPVADVPPDPDPNRKPWQIRAAVGLLSTYICSALFFLLAKLTSGEVHWGTFALLGLIVALTIKVSEGQRWARTVFTVLAILDLVVFSRHLYRFPNEPVWAIIVEVIQATLLSVPLILFYTEIGSRWFSRPVKE